MCYRSSLKTALSITDNINNEIIYVESGKYPLACKIKKLQLKFWIYVQKYIQDFPEAALSAMVSAGLQAKIPYLRHYQNLQTEFSDPMSCERSTRNVYFEKWKQKFETENDPDSRLGTYFRINPSLLRPVLPLHIMEIERILITRYRTGSHSLAIEIGRYSNTPRENRICKCNMNVQTVWHIFIECPLTIACGRRNFNNLNELFLDQNVHRTLIAISKVLKIPI